MNDSPNAESTDRLDLPCPCGSDQPYGHCCRPHHTNKTTPSTAEQLMRSRYSAYFFRLVDYLVATQHPDTRTRDLRQDLIDNIEGPQWRSLEIIATSKGTKNDSKGKVEFLATYHFEEKLYEMHEKSRFRKHKGKWKYLDAKG